MRVKPRSFVFQNGHDPIKVQHETLDIDLLQRVRVQYLLLLFEMVDGVSWKTNQGQSQKKDPQEHVFLERRSIADICLLLFNLMDLKLLVISFSIFKVNIVKVAFKKTVSLDPLTQISILVQNFCHQIRLDCFLERS